ncbi:MAG: hypothetical protein EOO05_15485 [Chitinophagaceae bacterium]|nr:MAG: hypothetical protein EOO05_15485 [Chitinophagaceae bacterium]
MSHTKDESIFMNSAVTSPSSEPEIKDITSDPIAAEAVALASRLLETAHAQQSAGEKREAAQMSRLMEDKAGKAFLFAMVDETFRASQSKVAARRWRGIMYDFGIPEYPAQELQ